MNLDRVVRGSLVLALIALVAVFVIYAVPQTVGADYSYVVLSGSMTPAIAPGDVVIVSEVDPSTLEEGDVVSFVRAEEAAPTTHRIIDVQQQDGTPMFETKGDAVEDPDPELVPAGNVIGTVVLTIPFIGHVVQFTNTTLGFVTLLGIPLGLLVGTEVWSLVAHQRNLNGASARSDTEQATAETRQSEAGKSTVDEPERGEPADEESHGEDRADSADEKTQADTDSGERVAISLFDLRATTVVLAILTLYGVYVALQLRTALSVSIAFASAFALVAISGMHVAVRFPSSDDENGTADESAVPGDHEVTADGGSKPTEDSGDPEQTEEGER